MTVWQSFASGSAAVIAIFGVAWMVAVKLRFYSLVDAVWAFAIGAVSGSWLAMGDGDPLKRIVAAVMVLGWSCRLGGHLSRRLAGSFPEEDSRYTELLGRWRGREKGMFFGFFLIQGISAILLGLPFLLIGGDRSGFGVWEMAGAAISIFAISGEAIADHQMAAFRKKHNDRKRVCDVGLWRYSRHPNYFFESMIWVGFYVFACGSASGWMTVHAPLIIGFLLLRVTGVPPSEASSLASKGDSYREYQKTTSVFIPLPPKKIR